jgi:hypothetical protein
MPWQLQHPTANAAPRTDEGRQTRSSTHGLAAACMAFNRDANADHARLGGSVFTRKCPDVLRRSPRRFSV